MEKRIGFLYTFKIKLKKVHGGLLSSILPVVELRSQDVYGTVEHAVVV
jgi:hypothetical protein